MRRVKIARSLGLAAGVCALVLAAAPPSNARGASDRARTDVCRPNPEPTPRTGLPVKLKPFSGMRLTGTRTLWTVVDLREPHYVTGQGGWELRKQPWFRLEEGQLTISGRRVDGGSGTFQADLPPMDAYPLDLNPWPGFIPSSFTFSTGGCWKVTAQLGRSKVALYFDVDDSTAAICADLAASLRVAQRADNPDEHAVAAITTDQRAHQCPTRRSR
jgi:hypothetical protein